MSASWKIFGQRLHAPLPTAHIARNMGLSRQAVQRLANEMERDDLVRFAPNPHHERAKFVLMTDQGKAAFHSAMVKQRRWAESLAEGFSSNSITDTARLLRELRQKLEKS
jgi:DNA-binding MarR family transcriptional regulator